MAAVPVGGGSSAPGHTDGATAGQNSPSTLLLTACAGQNSPCSPKMAQFDAFCPCRANFLPLSPPTSHAGRTFSCARHDNIATLKPTTPLLTPNRGPLKPASPLHPKNAPKHPFRTRKGDTGFNPIQIPASKGDDGFRQPTQLAYRARLRCPRVAGPGRTTRRRTEPHASTPGPTGVEGAGGTGGICRSAGGRWRGLAGLRGDAPSHTSAHQVPLVWRAPEGPEGTGGLRDRPLRAFRLVCGDLAGGRARRRPEHQRRHKQHHQ